MPAEGAMSSNHGFAGFWTGCPQEIKITAETTKAVRLTDSVPALPDRDRYSRRAVPGRATPPLASHPALIPRHVDDGRRGREWRRERTCRREYLQFWARATTRTRRAPAGTFAGWRK